MTNQVQLTDQQKRNRRNTFRRHNYQLRKIAKRHGIDIAVVINALNDAYNYGTDVGIGLGMRVG